VVELEQALALVDIVFAQAVEKRPYIRQEYPVIL
jgi:hypothetical protein